MRGKALPCAYLVHLGENLYQDEIMYIESRPRMLNSCRLLSIAIWIQLSIFILSEESNNSSNDFLLSYKNALYGRFRSSTPNRGAEYKLRLNEAGIKHFQGLRFEHASLKSTPAFIDSCNGSSMCLEGEPIIKNDSEETRNVPHDFYLLSQNWDVMLDDRS